MEVVVVIYHSAGRESSRGAKNISNIFPFLSLLFIAARVSPIPPLLRALFLFLSRMDSYMVFIVPVNKDNSLNLILHHFYYKGRLMTRLFL